MYMLRLLGFEPKPVTRVSVAAAAGVVLSTVVRPTTMAGTASIARTADSSRFTRRSFLDEGHRSCRRLRALRKSGQGFGTFRSLCRKFPVDKEEADGPP